MRRVSLVTLESLFLAKQLFRWMIKDRAIWCEKYMELEKTLRTLKTH